ncbi:MAG: GTP-binding protein [Saprospiraceae bacterium]
MYKDNVHNWTKKITEGDRQAISKALTLLESNKIEDLEFAKKLIEQLPLNRSSTSLRIGITGSPGVGKSSIIECLGLLMLKENLKVGVLTIDPSSSISYGSILGDKSRMTILSQEKNAFIRPTSSSNLLGGLSRNTRNSLKVLEAAGYQRIIIETVGIGQSEIDVVNLCDLLIYVVQPGSGDELQALKRGIMEWADIFVINKSDGVLEAKANETFTELSSVLSHLPLREKNHSAAIYKTSILKPELFEKLNLHINDYYNSLLIENKLITYRNAKDTAFFERNWINALKIKLEQGEKFKNEVENLKEDINSGKIDVENAFGKLIKSIFALP